MKDIKRIPESKFSIGKRTLLILVFIGFSLGMNAQIPMGVDVNIFPPYPTQYNIWVADGSNYMITIQNNSDTEFEYYIRAGIEGESGGEETFARISPDFFPIESLIIGPNEVTTITSVDLEDLYRNAGVNDLDRSPNIPIDDINGELPEGTYMLCFELMLYDPSQEIFLSPKVCSEPFTVSHSSLELVYPQDQSVWDATDVPVTFQWMNNTSLGLTEDYEYELAIYEIDAGSINDESIYEYIETGGVAFFTSDPVPDLNYIYDVDFGLPEFTEGNLYAARVMIVNTNGTFFDGGGISNINTFWFGYNPNDDGGGGEDEEAMDCFERCQVPLPTNTTSMADLTTVTEFRIGHFDVDDVELSDVTTGIESISGTGYVTFEFMNGVKIEVEFSGVTLNTEGQALSGTVTGLVEEPNRNIVDIIGGAIDNFQPLDQDALSSLSDVCSNLLVVNKILNGAKVSLPFGLSQQIDGQAFTFALVDFEATPENANMDFVNILDFSSLGDGMMLGVGATDICVAPDGPGREYKINLLSDANLPIDGDLSLMFKGGAIDEGASYDLKTNQSPCYFEMACEGFKAVNISGTVTFPQSMLRKEVDGIMVEEENAKGYFSSTYERDFSELSLTNDPIPRTDFIVDLAMDDFQLSKLKGWGFTVANASLDLSESRNPQYLVFPEGYDKDFTVDDEWKGFYIKDATLRTPKDYAEDGIVGTADINHILIDNSLSMDIEAYNMLSREQGNFKGWALGIDTFELKVLQNTLQHGHIDGKFSAPVMDPQEYLDFYAMVDEVTDDPEETYYTFDGHVTPSENLDIPMAIANASVCQSSYLAIRLSPIPEDRLIELFLKGDLDVNTGGFGEMVTGNAYMRLADYQLQYNSVDGFVSMDEVDDGRGTYFGANDNEEIDCSDLDITTLQHAFDFMMDRMIESDEGVFRNIAEQIEIEAEEGATFRDGDEMNGLPIRFDRSNLTIINGEPVLSLIVEVQLTPESIIEAGIVIESGITQVGRKFKISPSSIELYYTEGSISLDQPVNGSGLATNEAVSVAWTPNFQDADIRNRLLYDIRIIELTQDDNLDRLDSIFRSRTTFFHEVENVSGITHELTLDSISPNFTNGKGYAMIMQATDPGPDGVVGNDDDIDLNGDGYTNVNRFTWGQTAIVGTNDGNNSVCAARCSPSLPSDTTAHASPSTVSSFKMGNFIIEVTGSPTQSGQLISGTGVALFDGFLNDARLGITFTDVALNNSAVPEAMQGQVLAKEADPNLIDQVGNYLAGNTSPGIINTLSQFLDEARMITDLMTTGEVDLPFGVSVNMTNENGTAGNSVNIAFTDFQLTPTTSDIDFLFMMSLPSLGEGLEFGLGATDMCIHPEGFGSEARLYLPDDIEIPIDGDVSIQFSGGQVAEISVGAQPFDPFYLEIDCDGFKALNISGYAEFPRSMIVKEDITTGQIIPGENVKGYFGMNLQRTAGDAYVSNPSDARTDLILAYTMDPFQVKGLDGWGFEVTEAVLDLSEADNLAGMSFPANYDMGDLPAQEFWTGFYLKRLKFKPPSAYALQEDGSLDGTHFTIDNLLIDPEFSAVFSAQNLLSYEQGNIKGWGMSIDSFGLSILQNNFQSGGMRGEMGAPPMGDDDRLLYRALIDRQASEDGEDSEDENDSYLFKAVVRPPADGITIPMLVAEATVCGSSYLGIQLGKGEDDTQMELFIKSALSVDFDQSPIDIPGAFNLALADFQLQYNTVNGFVMESEAADGKGTAIGLGLGADDVCDTEPYFPDFSAMVEQYQSTGGGNADRDVAGEDMETGAGSSNSDSSDTTSSTSDDGTEGTSSPSSDPEDEEPLESAMNGFPIRLNNFDLALTDGKPQFSFTVDLALASGGQGFAAGTGLTIYTKKEPNDEGKEKIKFDHVGFDCARLAVDLDFLEILACLCHENEVYPNGAETDGYFGRVMVNAMDQIFIDLQGGFATYKTPGSTQYGTEDYHGFWYIDGTFASNSGIPIGPLKLNALGGGIYWNMSPPPLPGHDDIDDAESDSGGAAQEVNDCIQELATTYDIDMPNGGAPLAASPDHDPGTYPEGTYGLRTIKFNAGLSFADPKLVILDPLVSVTWAANQGINEITVGGYLYLLQNDYFSRGAPSQPPTNNPEDSDSPDLEFSAKQGESSDDESANGSKIWLAAFNTLYFDRLSEPGNTLTAFRGTGSMYLNVIPNVLMGTAKASDPYNMISHDIFIGHNNHEQTRDRGYSTGTTGTYWHAHLGNPYTDMGRGAISFDLAAAAGGEGSSEPTGEAAGLEVTAYMMMGGGIPTTLPDPPQFITDILDGRVTSEASDDDSEGSGYDGDDISESDASREELADQTTGFALGATVGINANFDKIIYANLEVVLGMDLLFMNVAGMQCIAPDGDLYDPPGVKNFYGLGQIFAGIKGAVGVKGKILGKEIDIEFLSLAAAMLIQAGGPNPFWIDGRAAVSYSVLGGLIKGNARVEIEVGDRCYPYNADPFTLDVINKVYPTENHTNSNPMDPYHHPKVTFKMPVGTPSNPSIAEMIIPEVDPDGNTAIRRIAPVMEHFRVYRDYPSGTTDTLVDGDITFSGTRRSVRYQTSSPMSKSDQQQGNRRFRFDLLIKAKEKINGNWSYIDEFRADTSFRFFAAPLPPYEKYVTHTNPIRGQRYFMDDEWRGTSTSVNGNVVPMNKGGKIKFRSNNMINERLYTTDNQDRQCEYDIVWKEETNGEEIHRHRLPRSDIFNDHILFPIPELGNSTTYILQLVRRKIGIGSTFFLGGIQRDATKYMSVSTSTTFDVDNEYTIEYPEDDDNEYLDVAPNETLIHHVVFRTSRFNNISDKLADAETYVLPQGTDCGSYCLAYDRVKIAPGQELFEEIEFLGMNTVLNFGPNSNTNFFTKQRIFTIDPFEGDYFDDIRPKMNTLIDRIRVKIDSKEIGLRAIVNYVTYSYSYNFGEASYNYINTTAYNNSQFETYGNNSVLLEDYGEGSNPFAPPINQNSNNSLFNGGYGGSINIGENANNYEPNTIYFTYRIRNYVKNDIQAIVNWAEAKLDMIKDPPYPYFNIWTDGYRDTRFNSTYLAYNSVVNSSMFDGNNSPITISANSGDTWSAASTGQNFIYPYGSSLPPFRSGEINFFHNVNVVDSNEGLNLYSDKVVVEIDD